jgi:hypothetical protein
LSLNRLGSGRARTLLSMREPGAPFAAGWLGSPRGGSASGVDWGWASRV